MLRVLSWLLLLFAVTAARGQVEEPAVTVDQVEAAQEQAEVSMAEDDPAREPLLNLYREARAALLDYQKYVVSVEEFNQARTNAPGETESIQQELAARQADPAEVDPSLAQAGLEEAEQMIQLLKSELEALRTQETEGRAAVDDMPGRATAVRDRLTELVGVLANVQSQLSLLNQSPAPASEEEARLWLAQAQLASATAEKASLDAELLSQPIRQDLLKAQLDKLNLDIGSREARLSVLEQRAGELRQGEAEEALAEAERARASALGKHELVQELAAENAELTESFGARSAGIEKVRSRDSEGKQIAEELERDLKSIERKLEILGMTTTIGEILREKAAELPSARDVRRANAEIGDRIQANSMRQIELEGERRELRDTAAYVHERILAHEPDTWEELEDRIGDDMADLALARRDLVKKALELESTYASALTDLDLTLRRKNTAVREYREFINERLLWIPSREVFSMFRDGGILEQLPEMFEPARWQEILRELPGELVAEPLTTLSFVLLILLIYFTPRLYQRLRDTGRTVGYTSDDLYTNTLKALALSALLAFKWPMLMLTAAWLFDMQKGDSTLAAALSAGLSRTALYFWGLEILRVILRPGCLAESHFRWPVSRVNALHRRVLRLQQVFLPATFVVVFTVSLYPKQYGGQLGALGVAVVLLAIAYFFYRLPRLSQGSIDLIFVDSKSGKSTSWSRILRLVLTWIPVLGIGAVFAGYSYTAIEFALLLIQTIVLYSVILLVQEMGLRWLRLAQRRMRTRLREELSRTSGEEGEISPEEEILENDPDLLSDEGTKLLNSLIAVGALIGVVVIWAEVFPALGILDSVELWHQTGILDGSEAIVPVTLGDIFVALAIGILGWIAARRIPGLLEILLRQRIKVSAGSAYAASRIFQYALVTLIVVLVMSAMGGSWSQIQWAVAALSVGIGFGLQEIVANFISGLIILFEQPIRVGDTVTVGNVSGVVTKIRMRATTIRDWDRKELLVPNKEFITSQLLNWSLSDPITRCSIEVGVAYGTDMYRAMEAVREVVSAHPRVMDDPAPFITFDSFGDNSLQITVRVYLDDPDIRLSTSSALRLAINDRFNAEGIVVAFPQRDVHLDTSTPLDVRMVPEAGR